MQRTTYVSDVHYMQSKNKTTTKKIDNSIFNCAIPSSQLFLLVLSLHSAQNNFAALTHISGILYSEHLAPVHQCFEIVSAQNAQNRQFFKSLTAPQFRSEITSITITMITQTTVQHHHQVICCFSLISATNYLHHCE